MTGWGVNVHGEPLKRFRKKPRRSELMSKKRRKKSVIGYADDFLYKVDLWWDFGRLEMPIIHRKKIDAKQMSGHIQKVKVTIEEID